MVEEHKGALGKYRDIVIAVAFFLIFDLAVLVLNFYTTYQLAEDVVAVNLAGRQRMLSQQMTKSLLLLKSDADNPVEADRLNLHRDELTATVRAFDETLRGFRDGGKVTGTDGSMVLLAPVATPRGRDIMSQANQLWSAQHAALQTLINNPVMDPDALSAAVSHARSNNIKLLALMNALTGEMEQVANQRLSRLRTVQAQGLALALLNFLFIVLKFVRQLRQSDKQTEAAQRETEGILATVREGLFLLDRQFRIGSQHSASLHKILQHEVQAGADFMPILRQMVDASVFETAQGYIELLFGNRVKERLVGSLNPLSEVEVKLPDAQGNPETRYLAFQFNRVMQGGQVPHLLVTVQDVTERVMLMRQLAAAKSDARLEVNVMLRMLATEPAVLRNFLASMEGALRQINTFLREAGERHQGAAQDYLHVINQSFRLIHTCKGEAGALGLEMLETEAHAFETALAELRERGNPGGDDMVGLSVLLNSLFERVNTVREITDQIASAGRGSAPAESLHSGLENLVTRMAKSQGKEVHVSSDLAILNQLPVPIASEVRQIAIQMVRNAVTHGIEVPDERVRHAKPRFGHVHVACQPLAEGGFRFVVRDDGRGLSPEQIRASLVAAGVCSEAEAAAMEQRELIMRIFDPGFSTAPAVDSDAGHGVGMDVVLEKVRALGGRLHLTTRPNEYTEFSIRFPGFTL